MESLYRTPLLDCFRRGEVAADIRMMAAQGVLAPRAHEQLGLLVLLVGRRRPGHPRRRPRPPSRAIPRPTCRASWGGRTSRTRFVDFFVRARDRARAVGGPGDRTTRCSTPTALDAPAGDDESDDEAAPESRRGQADGDHPAPVADDRVGEDQGGDARVPRGAHASSSAIPNKLVSLAVLSSPKVNEREIESYAKMANVSEDVLRVIGTTRAWTKSYAIVRALAFNPKSPIAVSMALVSRLVEKDVRMLSIDRNIAEPVKLLARKVLQAGQSRRD